MAGGVFSDLQFDSYVIGRCGSTLSIGVFWPVDAQSPDHEKTV